MAKVNWDSYEWVMEAAGVVFGTIIFQSVLAPLIPQDPDGGFSWARALVAGIFVAFCWRLGHVAGAAIDRALR